jgi:ubiquinone/menaquinone biosynthesis C-methylase UbiE
LANNAGSKAYKYPLDHDEECSEAFLKMTIQHAYNQWSTAYDRDQNITRDLDQAITFQVFKSQNFKNILELGCGTGKNTVLFADIASAVHALDFSEGMLEQARQKLPANNIRFAAADLTHAWPCDNEAYDFISCNLVLEHIENLSFIFQEAFRCLGKGGQFYISEFHPFRQYQGGKARYQENEKIIEVDAYVHHMSEILNAAKQSGFSVISVDEHWHQDDIGRPPRLATFLFQKL